MSVDMVVLPVNCSVCLPEKSR